MSLIRQALEGCQNCALAESQDKDNKPVQTDITYNEGDGIKDTVIIDGPLSQVFTKALNVKLKKQPLTSEPEEKVAPLVTKPQEEQKDDYEVTITMGIHPIDGIGADFSKDITVTSSNAQCRNIVTGKQIGRAHV